MARKKNVAAGLSKAEALADEIAAYPPDALRHFLSRLFIRLPAEQRLLVDAAIPRDESVAYKVGLLRSGRAQPLIDAALEFQEWDEQAVSKNEATAWRCYLLRTADPVKWSWGRLAKKEGQSRAAVQGATERFARAHPELDPLPTEDYVQAIKAGDVEALWRYDKALREAVNARRAVSG
jgi:hypothetical protein